MKKTKRLKSRVISNPVFLLFVVAMLTVPIVLSGILLFIEGPALSIEKVRLLIIIPIATAVVSLLAIFLFAHQNMTAFAGKAYALSPQEARQFVQTLILGPATLPPVGPVLVISEGRVDPDGPDRLKKVGGPGYLSIRPDSAVITCRGGHLHRILGPGFHELESFERVWDAVDLRRQRRTATVEAVTRDGIPVSAEVEVFFQVDNGGQAADELKHYPFDPQTILHLTTMSRVLKDGTVQKWPTQVLGKAKGALRNKLESMQLEDIFNLQEDNTPPLVALSQEIERLAREGVAPWGVKVEAVHVSSVQPLHKSVSERWIQHWRAGWERAIRRWNAQAKTESWQEIESARVQAEADLLLRTLEKWGELLEQSGEASQEVLAQRLQLRFMDMLRTMASQDPFVQAIVLEQADILREMLTTSSDEDNG